MKDKREQKKEKRSLNKLVDELQDKLDEMENICEEALKMPLTKKRDAKEEALEYFKTHCDVYPSFDCLTYKAANKALNIAIQETRKQDRDFSIKYTKRIAEQIKRETRKQTAKEIFEKLESMASFTGLQKMFFHNEAKKF